MSLNKTWEDEEFYKLSPEL